MVRGTVFMRKFLLGLPIALHSGEWRLGSMRRYHLYRHRQSLQSGYPHQSYPNCDDSTMVITLKNGMGTGLDTVRFDQRRSSSLRRPAGDPVVTAYPGRRPHAGSSLIVNGEYRGHRSPAVRFPGRESRNPAELHHGPQAGQQRRPQREHRRQGIHRPGLPSLPVPTTAAPRRRAPCSPSPRTPSWWNAAFSALRRNGKGRAIAITTTAKPPRRTSTARTSSTAPACT